LFGAEIGARVQFDRLVLGIGADFTWFTKDKGTNVTAQGTFFNSNGFTGYSQALGCIFGTATAPAGPCVTLQNLNTSGSVITVNSGGYAANLAIQSNPDWVGTVRGSVGFAIDRLLLTASGGLAYAPGALKVSGTYTDRTASACSGVANVYSASTNGGVPGESFVRYNCTGGAVAAFNSISQVVTTTVNYSGSRGGMLTGFAGGGGATYAVTDNVALSFEGMYYNLGTATATVTGAGTQTTTTTTIANSVPGGPPTTVTATAAVAGPTLVVSRVIDGYVFKGGVQLKF
jgi:opacity protein-like surface antigen